MMMYYSDERGLFEKINHMTLEQQAQVIKLIEEIEAADQLTIPRIILSNDNHLCLIRAKDGRGYNRSELGISPVKLFVEYSRNQHKLLIGEPTAQKVIEEIGSVVPLPQEHTFMVKGRSLESGLPASIEISSIQVRDVMSKSFDDKFFEGLKWFLTQSHFTFRISMEDLAQVPIILRGSLSHIMGLRERLQEVTGMKVILE